MAIEKENNGKSVLVVENDADDAFFIRRSLHDFQEVGCCFVCRNVSEARAYLKGSGMYADRQKYPFPDLVITDFRLVRDTGLELIRFMRENQEFATLPVYILTSSASPTDMQAALQAGASRVLKKPATFEDLRKVLEEIARKA